jgi:hypothetical protein
MPVIKVLIKGLNKVIDFPVGSKMDDIGKHIQGNWSSVEEMSGLPMDAVSRKERAQYMGFDPEVTYYHGTRRNFDEFEAMQPRGAQGNKKGVYFTKDKSTAEEYAMDVDGALDEKSRVIEVNLRNPEHQNKGYSGDEYIINDPKNIRSVNAAFDPSKKESANLLAGVGAAAVGVSAMSPEEAEAGALGKTAKRIIKNMSGDKIEAPRMFYRGVKKDGDRVLTGNKLWDSHLFAADDFEKAKLYGDDVVGIGARDDANILYEGTKEWKDITKSNGPRKGETLLDYADRTSRAAQEAGYDAAWYKRQSDIGTSIFNPDAFKRVDVDKSGQLVDKSVEISGKIKQKTGDLLSGQVDKSNYLQYGGAGAAVGLAALSPEQAQAHQQAQKSFIDSMLNDQSLESLPSFTTATAPGIDQMALPQQYRADIGGFQAPGSAVPSAVHQAGGLLKKFDTPILGNPVEGLADYMINFGYDDSAKERAKRAASAGLDLI